MIASQLWWVDYGEVEYEKKGELGVGFVWSVWNWSVNSFEEKKASNIVSKSEAE